MPNALHDRRVLVAAVHLEGVHAPLCKRLHVRNVLLVLQPRVHAQARVAAAGGVAHVRVYAEAQPLAVHVVDHALNPRGELDGVRAQAVCHRVARGGPPVVDAKPFKAAVPVAAADELVRYVSDDLFVNVVRGPHPRHPAKRRAAQHAVVHCIGGSHQEENSIKIHGALVLSSLLIRPAWMQSFPVNPHRRKTKTRHVQHGKKPNSPSLLFPALRLRASGAPTLRRF
jgi:hypothetical protein